VDIGISGENRPPAHPAVLPSLNAFASFDGQPGKPRQRRARLPPLETGTKS
jgi:hypothetical protein